MELDHRVVAFAVDDVAADYEQVAQCLNRHCLRHIGYKVSGVCQTGAQVLFTFEENAPARQQRRYVLAPFSSVCDADVVADLYDRWRSGFTTKGLIRLTDSYLGLFEVAVETGDRTLD